MMKNKHNYNYEHENEKHRRQKMIRTRQLKIRIFVCLMVFGAAFLSAVAVGNQVVSGKKGNNKNIQKNVNTKKSAVMVSHKKTQITEPKKKPEQTQYKKQYEVDPDKPMVALTFDDGPGLRTMEILEALEKNGARATFFTCGVSLNRMDINTEAVLQKMKAIGCDVSNHTMEHKQLSTLSKKEIKRQISGVNKILKKYTGEGGAQLRPPYGDGIHNKKVIKNVGMPMIYWSIDTLDWKTKSKTKTVKAVMKNVQDGDIILMHDTHSWSVDAAIEIIPKLIKKGYQLVTVSEMAEARGVELENGKTYFDFRP